MSNLQALREFHTDFEKLYGKYYDAIEFNFEQFDEFASDEDFAKTFHFKMGEVGSSIEKKLEEIETERFVKILTEQGKPIPDYLQQPLKDEFEVSIEAEDPETGIQVSAIVLLT